MDAVVRRDQLAHRPPHDPRRQVRDHDALARKGRRDDDRGHRSHRADVRRDDAPGNAATAAGDDEREDEKRHAAHAPILPLEPPFEGTRSLPDGADRYCGRAGRRSALRI